MDGLRRLLYRIKVPPGVLQAIPAVVALLNKLYPGRWSFKVSSQVRAGGQIVLTAELRLGRARR